MVGGLYGLHRWTSGKRIDEPAEVVGDGNVIVKDSEGTTITVTQDVYNVYVNNPRVPEALAHTFEALDEDTAITGFAISEDAEPIFAADKAEFGSMAQQPQLATVVSGIEVISEEAYLHVVKTVLERNYTRKWEFVRAAQQDPQRTYEMRSSSTTLSRTSTVSAQGDVLRVKLETSREFSAADRDVREPRIQHRRTVLEFIPRTKDAPVLRRTMVLRSAFRQERFSAAIQGHRRNWRVQRQQSPGP